MDRTEIISEMLSAYKAELEALSDAELMAHWQFQKATNNMTDAEWQELATKAYIN